MSERRLGIIRLWRDELTAMPEYSTSLPTGICDGKTWKRRHGDGWLIGAYCFENDGTFKVLWFAPVILSGPRRPSEKTRFKHRC